MPLRKLSEVTLYNKFSLVYGNLLKTAASGKVVPCTGAEFCHPLGEICYLSLKTTTL